MVLKFILLLLVPSLILSAQPDQIIEIFRHGARAPATNYDPSWSASELGNLTPVGMRQQYILGKVLSEIYLDTFKFDYDYKNVYCLSDTTPRCIESAVTHLYGVYLGKGPALRKDYPKEVGVPPFQDDRVKKIADSLQNFAAIPSNAIPNIVNIVDDTNAAIFQGSGSKYCPNSPTWAKQNTDDVKMHQIWALFQNTINNANTYLTTAQKIKTPQDLLNFGDAMAADIADNRTVVGGIKDGILLRNLSYAAAWTGLHIYFGQTNQKQLAAFNLMDAVLTEMTNFRQGKNSHRVALFSGHDTNLNSILSTFGIVNEDCILANFLAASQNFTVPFPNCYAPGFAASIVIELYNTSKTPTVKFFYNNALIRLCSGKDTCTYDEFMFFAKNAIGNNTPATYKTKCTQATQEEEEIVEAVDIQVASISSVTENQSKFAFIGFVGMTVLCALLVAKIMQEKRKYNQLVKETRTRDFLYKRIEEVKNNSI